MICVSFLHYLLIFMGGSGLFGPCLFLVLCMVLRLLLLLMLVCVSCGLLLSGLCGPVVSFLPILVRYLVCWMVRLGVILHFALCGSGSVCSVGFLLAGRVRFPGFIGFWSVLLVGALVMVLLSCLLRVPLRLGLFGLLRWLVGFGKACRF